MKAAFKSKVAGRLSILLLITLSGWELAIAAECSAYKDSFFINETNTKDNWVEIYAKTPSTVAGWTLTTCSIEKQGNNDVQVCGNLPFSYTQATDGSFKIINVASPGLHDKAVDFLLKDNQGKLVDYFRVGSELDDFALQKATAQQCNLVSSCNTHTRNNNGQRNFARMPDGGCQWEEDNWQNNTKDTTNAGEAPVHHYEIDLPPVGLTCQSNTITVRACASSTAPCTTSLASTSTTTTLSTNSGSFTNAGGATQTFTGSTNYALSATVAATVTIGITNPSTTPNCYSLNGTTRTLLASCSFQVKTAAFIFSVPDFSAGDGSGNITISAQQEDDATKKCVSFTPSGNVKMWTDYINPATGTKQATLTYGSDYTLPTSAPGSGNVPLVFNSSGQASISLNYWDAGNLRLNAQWNQVTGYSDFVVKPYFVISDITCSDLTVNPAASGPGGAKFCRAGESFSATVKAVAANRTTTTPNFGRETPAESVKLTTALVSPVGGENPALLGSLAKDAGDPSIARSTSLSWGEVGIISLTPGIDDGDYLGAGNVTADAVARVGRFYPHHFATAITPPMECPGTAPAFVCPASNGTPASGMAYAGQTFTASITARNASGGTTQNYDKDTGYANAGGVAAYTAKGGAAVPSGAASGSLSGNAATASDFIKGKATLSTAKYTFTTPPGTASDIYLRASETSGDAVTSLRNPSSDSVEGGLKIAQGRLRLINAFGNGKQPLKMQAEVQFWSGTSWVRNNKDSTALTQSAIIVSDPAKLSISNFTFSNGSGEITLTATTAGSYDVSANLGATGAALASCTSGLSGGSAANVPWLRSRNGTCTASDSFAADPTARATFGVYAPESKKTIHVREFY